jgi:hypothetical protein
MAGLDGLDTLTRLRELDPNAIVIMISGHGTLQTASRPPAAVPSISSRSPSIPTASSSPSGMRCVTPISRARTSG